MDIAYDRSSIGPHLGGEAIGIGFEYLVAIVASLDLVFIDFAFAQVGDKKFPDSAGPARAHGVAVHGFIAAVHSSQANPNRAISSHSPRENSLRPA